MTDRNARPPEKVNRDFVKPKQTPAQRKRQQELEDAEEFAAHQAELRRAFYERQGLQPPEENAA